TDVNADGTYLFPTPPQATAYVVDSQGNRKDFKTNGIRDSTFKGRIGETYKLNITADGETYESSAETMRACPEIDTLIALYTRESNRNEKDLLYDGFDVYAQFQDIPGQESYYQWDWVHYERQITCGVREENGQTVRLRCSPTTCWDIKYNNRIIVQSDRLRDGQPIAHRLVRVPFATPPNKYYLQVEQRAISPSVFEYLKSLETQTQNVGSLFDLPAQTRFSPNIQNVNNPKEQIIGVFNVFSSRRKVILTDMRQEIPGATAKYIGDPRPFTSDPLAFALCIEGQYRTLVRPEDWME
ncbi:MAG: DUF4249 domain-containing protein, partial [Saprospiraceae bacterium]